MAAVFVFIVLILRPTPDVGEFAKRDAISKMPAAIQAMQPTKLTKLASIISGAFLDFWLPSAAFILFAGWWCFLRRRLLMFALPVTLLVALYVLIHGYAHHHGTVFVAAITALWIACPNGGEFKGFSVFERRAFYSMVAALLLLSAVNIWDAAVAIRNDYLYPYSGAENAANYLRSVGADREKVVAFLYGAIGVQPYFDRNIFENFSTAYYHHGLPFVGLELDVNEFRRMSPDYVVAFTEQPQMMMEYDTPALAAEGYEIVHFSDGYMIYKRGVYVRQVYLIFRRVRP
jgi:hypothetical protein